MLSQNEIESFANNSLYLLRDFISLEQEQYLISKVNSTSKLRWKQLSSRRLLIYGVQELKKGIMIHNSLPDFLVPILKEITSTLQSVDISLKINQCLTNEYLPGQGIMPHNDGPLYHPVVSTVSLGESCLLDFHKTEDDGIIASEPSYSILVPPRSLLVVCNSSYNEYCHGIAARNSDFISEHCVNGKEMLGKVAERNNTRISLTFRAATKVIRSNLFK